MFCHPIEHAVRAFNFNYLQIALWDHWEPTSLPEMQEWSIEQYDNSFAFANRYGFLFWYEVFVRLVWIDLKPNSGIHSIQRSRKHAVSPC